MSFAFVPFHTLCPPKGLLAPLCANNPTITLQQRGGPTDRECEGPRGPALPPSEAVVHG